MRFQKSKSNRFHKQFAHLVVNGYWWVHNKNKIIMVKNTDLDNYIKHNDYDFYSSTLSCKSLRRFKKIIKKYKFKKSTCTLVHNYIGYDIYY